MATIPGEQQYGGIPSARSGRGIATFDETAIGAGLEHFGAGLQTAAAAGQKMAITLAENKEKIERYATEASFQRHIFNEQQRYDRDVSAIEPGGADGFAQSWAQGYRKRSREWFANIPEALKPEYDLRLFEAQRGFFGHGFEFEQQEQFRAANVTMQEHIDNVLLPQAEAARDLPEPDRQGALDAVLETGRQMILNNPALTPIERDTAIRNWERQAQVAFVQGLPAEERGRYLGTDPATIADQIMYVEDETGNPHADNPYSSAYGFGQFIDSTWWDMISAYRPDLMQNPDGSTRTRAEVLALRSNEAIAHEMTVRYIEQNMTHLQSRGLPVTAGTVYLAHLMGPGGAEIILGVPSDTTIQELVDQGRIGSQVIPSNPFMRGMTTGDLIAWADRKMGDVPTQLPSTLNAIPYQDRQALAADAQTEMRQNAAAAASQRRAEVEASLNDLLIGIRNGTAGFTEIGEAQRDWLTDFDDIQRVDNAMQQYQGEMIAGLNAINRMANDGVRFNAFNNDDVDAIDAGYRMMGGVGNLLDPNATDEDRAQAMARLSYTVGRSNIVPEAALEALQNGIYETIPEIRNLAFQAMDHIYRNNPTAANHFFEEEQLNRLQAWQSIAPYLPAEEVTRLFNPLTDPAQIERRNVLREEGYDKAEAFPNDRLLNHFTRRFTATEADMPIDRAEFIGLRTDFERLFAEFYSMGANETQAQSLALEALSRVWGMTTTGAAFEGRDQVMRYPPEMMYEPIGGATIADGGYNWLGQAVEEFVAEQWPDENIQDYALVSSRRTEATAWTGQTEYDVWAVLDDGRVVIANNFTFNFDRYAAQYNAEWEAARNRALAPTMPAEFNPETGYFAPEALEALGIDRDLTPEEQRALMIERDREGRQLTPEEQRQLMIERDRPLAPTGADNSPRVPQTPPVMPVNVGPLPSNVPRPAPIPAGQLLGGAPANPIAPSTSTAPVIPSAPVDPNRSIRNPSPAAEGELMDYGTGGPTIPAANVPSPGVGNYRERRGGVVPRSVSATIPAPVQPVVPEAIRATPLTSGPIPAPAAPGTPERVQQAQQYLQENPINALSDLTPENFAQMMVATNMNQAQLIMYLANTWRVAPPMIEQQLQRRLTPAPAVVRNRNIEEMNMNELQDFIFNGDPNGDELRRANNQIELLRLQIEINNARGIH